MFWKGLEVPLS